MPFPESESGLHRSPLSQRLYLVEYGFVIAELSPQAEKAVEAAPLEGPLGPGAELDFVLRKTIHLRAFLADLDAFAALGAGFTPTADGFRPTELGRLDLTPLAPALRPRLAQLGNTGVYLYAQGGWRHLLVPTERELGILKRLPQAQLVPDAALEAFLAREIRDVAEELEAAKDLLEPLTDAARAD